MASIQRPTGTLDILPDEIPRWRALERACHEVFEPSGYREIRTPVFEHTELFVRGIGQVTDIVEKEMYSIPPKVGDEGRDPAAAGAASDDDAPAGMGLTLRPESTAPIVRAWLEAGWDKSAPLQKLWYMGPQFRYERKQAFRQRQFHQVGVELLGTKDALGDVELIDLALRYLAACGLDVGARLRLRLNSIGCNDPVCRPAYRERLRQYFHGRAAELCEDCKRRLERNVFRVLDCKRPECAAVREGAPVGGDWMCGACGEHFAGVRAGLDACGIAWELDPLIVRGLDYYVRTVFEITAQGLGAQDAIGAGGRYDGLLPELGGPNVGAVGFALGAERILGSLAAAGVEPGAGLVPADPALFLVVGDAALRPAAFALLRELRLRGLPAAMDLEARSFKAQMRMANRLGAGYVLIMGRELAERGEVTLKWMHEDKQENRPAGWTDGRFDLAWAAALAAELAAAPAAEAASSAPGEE